MSFNSVITVPPDRGKILSALSKNVDKASCFISSEDIDKIRRLFFWADLTKDDLLLYCGYKENSSKKKKKKDENSLGNYSVFLGLKYYEAFDAYLIFFLKSEPLMKFYMNKNVKPYKILLKVR